MTDLKKELIQKIKNGKVPVRLLHTEVYYPFECKYLSGDHLDELYIKKTIIPVAIAFNSAGKDTIDNGTQIYRDNTTLVKKMSKFVDDLREAIELEDYVAMKKIQESMDKLEIDRR